MARIQTRRTVSLNRDLFELIHAVAAKRGESAAQFISVAVRSRLKSVGYRKKLPRQSFDGPAANGRTDNRGAVAPKWTRRKGV